ncbi:MAG: DHH family phosphoesterase [Bacteroidales bacterium]|nr:DHH family phosphoesterase [Bacteroidales bacterium]
MAIRFDNKDIEELRSAIARANDIALISHALPDGDAVGSMLGLYGALANIYASNAKNVHLVLPNRPPSTFQYLTGFTSAVNADDQLDVCSAVLEQTDLIICLDFNVPSRVGQLENVLNSSMAPKILIDHHHSPAENFFCLVFSYPDISSTSELVYWLCLAAWGTASFNCSNAQCLYTGMVTDTGSFAYSCEQSSLYEAVAGLMHFNPGGATIHNHIFNNYSVARMRFLGYCISERLQVFESIGVAIITVSQQDMQHFGVGTVDLEGVVNYTLMMQPITVGALIKETERGDLRLSLRSKNDFDVNTFARTHFGGGGHTKAAGATLQGDIQSAAERVISLLCEAVTKFNQQQ